MSRRRTRRARRAAAIAGLAALGLAACGTDNDDGGASLDVEADDAFVTGEFDAVEEASEEPAEEVETDRPIEGDAAPRTGGAPATGLPIPDFGRDVITEVSMTMRTSDVRTTADDIRRLAVQNGGAVFRSDVRIDDEADDGSVPGTGLIVVRIPPQDLDRLIEALDGIGRVSQINQDSEDVTDQLVDLDIRIRQAEAGIAQIEALLDRTVELDQLFAIEAELRSRQIELERLLAQQRSTEDRVALATLTVQIEYQAPVAEADLVDEPGGDDDGIGDAFRTGWDAFVGILFAIGFVLAVTAPFVLTALVVVGLIWLVGRRWWHRSEPHAAGHHRELADVAPTVSSQTPAPDVDVTPDQGRVLAEDVDEPTPQG